MGFSFVLFYFLLLESGALVLFSKGIFCVVLVLMVFQMAALCCKKHLRKQDV